MITTKGICSVSKCLCAISNRPSLALFSATDSRHSFGCDLELLRQLFRGGSEHADRFTPGNQLTKAFQDQ
jgi:hypothetical protein